MTGNAWMFAATMLLAGAVACDGTEQPAVESSSGAATQPAGTSSGSGTPVAYGPRAGRGMGMGRGPGPGRGGRGPGPGGRGMGRGRGMGPGDCPVTIPSTTVEQEDIDGGSAMVFRTEGDIDELRRRVEEMAEHYRLRHGPGGRPPGRGMGHGRPEGMTPPPESAVTVDDIDGGARLELRPTDPEALDSLRAHVAQHVERMQDGTCGWMQPAGTDGPQ